MRSIAPLRTLVLAALLCSCAFSAIAHPNSAGRETDGPAPVDRPIFETPVFEYQRHLIKGLDPGPRLAIFDNGKVEVHFPVFMKNAGDFELFFSRDELLQLFLDLETWSFQDFDVQATLSELAAEQAQLNKPISPGASWTLFRWKPFVAHDSGELSFSDRSREFSWQGLAWTARFYPDNEALQRLSKIHQRMDALMLDPRLQPPGGRP